MSDPWELQGSRALVTGATKGIGGAVAARLRKAGARVLATARARPADVNGSNLFISADVTTAEGCAIVAGSAKPPRRYRHHRPRRRRVVRARGRLRGSRRSAVATRARPESLPRCPAGPGTPARHARAGLGRHHPHHLD